MEARGSQFLMMASQPWSRSQPQSGDLPKPAWWSSYLQIRDSIVAELLAHLSVDVADPPAAAPRFTSFSRQKFDVDCLLRNAQFVAVLYTMCTSALRDSWLTRPLRQLPFRGELPPPSPLADRTGDDERQSEAAPNVVTADAPGLKDPPSDVNGLNWEDYAMDIDDSPNLTGLPVTIDVLNLEDYSTDVDDPQEQKLSLATIDYFQPGLASVRFRTFLAKVAGLFEKAMLFMKVVTAVAEFNNRRSAPTLILYPLPCLNLPPLDLGLLSLVLGWIKKYRHFKRIAEEDAETEIGRKKRKTKRIDDSAVANREEGRNDHSDGAESVDSQTSLFSDDSAAPVLTEEPKPKPTFSPSTFHGLSWWTSARPTNQTMKAVDSSADQPKNVEAACQPGLSEKEVDGRRIGQPDAAVAWCQKGSLGDDRSPERPGRVDAACQAIEVDIGDHPMKMLLDAVAEDQASSLKLSMADHSTAVPTSVAAQQADLARTKMDNPSIDLSVKEEVINAEKHKVDGRLTHTATGEDAECQADLPDVTNKSCLISPPTDPVATGHQNAFRASKEDGRHLDFFTQLLDTMASQYPASQMTQRSQISGQGDSQAQMRKSLRVEASQSQCTPQLMSPDIRDASGPKANRQHRDSPLAVAARTNAAYLRREMDENKENRIRDSSQPQKMSPVWYPGSIWEYTRVHRSVEDACESSEPVYRESRA